MTATDFERAVIEVVKGLRRGEVVSYGEVAEAAGRPGAARAVGGVLSKAEGLPWWRVVSAGGALISPNPAEQGRRLQSEGVRVARGRVVTSRRRPR